MIKKSWKIPRRQDSEGFTFIKVGGLQSKFRKGQINAYKQSDGHLHVIEQPEHYEIHTDKFSSIAGPTQYFLHGLELLYCWLRKQVRK